MEARTHEGLLSHSILEEQIELEKIAQQEGVARYRKLAYEAARRGQASSLKPCERLLAHWFRPLVAAIRKDQRLAAEGGYDKGMDVWGLPIMLLDARKMAVITLHTVVSACLSPDEEYGEGCRFAALCYSVGRAVFAELGWEKLREDKPEVIKAINLKYKNITPQIVNRFARKALPKDDKSVLHVTQAAHLGVRLVYALWESASCAPYDEPFVHAFRIYNHKTARKSVKLMTLTDEAMRIIDDGHMARQYLRPRYLPMIVPPYPWQKDAQGGYVSIRTPLVAKPTRVHKDALAKADLTQLYQRLNALAATPWQVNRRIYNLARDIWSYGGGIGAIPQVVKIGRPARPDDYDTNEEAAARWRKDAVAVHRQNIALTSARFTFLQKLSVAERVAQRKAIYFPHQLDFRGRAYPVPPHLNHQNDDVCRAMLEFANPVPVTDAGRRWLRIHAANCYGIDKVTFADREAWVRANADKIEAVAENPLDTVRWWINADKPFQFVAACIALNDEYAAAHLPIQQDGSCNGLQHYAALTRDPVTAKYVNVVPSDEPQSVYKMVGSNVANLVQASGAPISHSIMRLVDEGLTKWVSLVKQPMMTTVYGVTFAGMRGQQQALLREAGLKDKELSDAATFLARTTKAAIGDICRSASDAMQWMATCARLIARKAGRDVRWVTPIGFPVVQAYRNWKTVTVKTMVGELDYPNVQETDVPIRVSRQINGIAPNFIHSLDATHMLNTALACHEAGVDFAAVHDGYMAHAEHGDDLAYILRREFVSLHSQNHLADLHNQFQAQHPEIEFPLPPEQGTLDLAVVMDSPYFFA